MTAESPTENAPFDQYLESELSLSVPTRPYGYRRGSLLRSELLPLVELARSLPNRDISLSQLIRLEDTMPPHGEFRTGRTRGVRTETDRQPETREEAVPSGVNGSES
ncbi:hypothetical protein HBNXHx_0498 [Haloferax volcanii]|nr:hypothetical protein HBNXHx_0498 [Haloferax alexandrinus]